MALPRRHMPIPTGHLMVLREGDDLFAHLEALMREEEIPSASFTGFGFARRVTFGFFDFDRAEYDPKTFERHEIAAMTGTLAWKDGAPSVHAHASAGDAGFGLVGGHLLALTVGTGSLEITVTRHDAFLVRRRDPAIGANVLQVPPES